MCSRSRSPIRLFWPAFSLAVLAVTLMVSCDGGRPGLETPAASSPAPSQTQATPLATLALATEQTPSFLPGPVTLNPAPEITLNAGDILPVVARSEGATSYEWLIQDADGARTLQETGNAIRYVAPQRADIVILTVIARVGEAASSPASLTIRVEPPIETAAVALSAVGIPAGWMSGGAAPETYISLQGGGETICHTGTDCFHFTYRPGGTWGGVYWWPQACGEAGTPQAWDAVRRGVCSIDVLQAGGLSNARQLTFWARGVEGGEVIEFKIGAPDVKPTPGRSAGKISLSPSWQQYFIDLNGLDLTDTIGLFLWTATDVDNPDGAGFYLDDMPFDGDQASP